MFCYKVVTWQFTMLTIITSFQPDNVILCLDKIREKYFQHHSMILYLHRKNNYDSSINDNDQRLIQMFMKSNTVETSDENYERPTEYFIRFRMPQTKAQQIVIWIENAFVQGEQELSDEIKFWISNAKWYGRGKILVILEKDDVKTITRVLIAIWKRTKALNTTIMSVSVDIINFYTWYPYKFPCGTKVEKVNTWTNIHGFASDNNLFPQKTSTNLNGCTLIASTMPSVPFVFPPLGEWYDKGFEVKMLRTLAKHLDFNIIYKEVPHNQNPMLAVDQNGVPTGLVGLLHRCESDIIFCGMPIIQDRFYFTEPLHPHYGDSMIWIVPQPNFQAPWLGIFVIFPYTMWILILMCMLAASIILHYIRKDNSCINNFLTSSLIIFASTINTSLPLVTNDNLQRCFLAMYFVYALNIATMYQSGVVDYLTKDHFEQPLATPMEAAKAGLTAYFFPPMRPELNTTDHDKWNQILHGSHQWTQYFDQTMIRAVQQKDVYMFLPKLPAKYAIMRTVTSQTGYPFVRSADGPGQKSVYYVFYTTRHHPLQPLLQRKVQQLVEGGFVEAWVANIINEAKKDMAKTSQVLNMHDPYASWDQGKVLTVSDLLAVFFILIGLNLTGFLIFLTEILWKFKRQRSKLKHRHF